MLISLKIEPRAELQLENETVQRHATTKIRKTTTYKPYIYICTLVYCKDQNSSISLHIFMYCVCVEKYNKQFLQNVVFLLL